MTIRTRFAPSPTGYLHIGGVRTALFSFLYARNQQGQFLLRIEDTDRERSKKEYEDEIKEALNWLGLKWDEEPLNQSHRLEHYRQLAAELIQKGLAYEDETDGRRAVKFKMPKQKSVFWDAVRGEVSFDTSLFDDLVIMKSDGYPTFHFACVIDDHETQITHVIRGEDHLSNTPRQILLFEAFGWKPPKYAHLPLIMGPDGTPLSKRHGASSLGEFRAQGYRPEAILNYLALLGWGADGNREFFKLEDLIKLFSLKRVTKSSARFDGEKMEWINAQHIKQMEPQAYLKEITVFCAAEAKSMEPRLWERLALLYQGRMRTFADFKKQADYCFEEIRDYDRQAAATFFDNAKLKHLLETWCERAGALADFEDIQALEKITRDAAEAHQLQAKDAIHPLRFALTGKTVSPGLFEVMSVLGKERCLQRVRRFVTEGSSHV